MKLVIIQYKIKDILNVINKYDAIFDLVVVPL